MATPAAPVSTPAAPAAPSAPAASAPTSQPAAPPAAAPSTDSGAPPAAGGAGAPPPAAPPAEPKNTDFANTRDGQIDFLAAHKKWEAEKAKAPAAPPAADPKAVADQLGAQPGEQPKPAEGAQPADAKPAEGAAKPAEDAATATPKAIADLLEAKPERKAFLEGDPDLKGMLFANARRLAAIEPIAEKFPTVADADFAIEHSAAMVGLKTASMQLIDNPEAAGTVLDMLDQQFAMVDKDGKPVLGADGKPTFAADRQPFIDAVVSREVTGYKNQFTREHTELEQKLKTGVYPNEAARAQDQKRLDDLDYALAWADMWDQIKSGEFFRAAVPEVPADASPEFKAWAEEERKRIAEESKKLDEKKSGQNKAERQAQTTEFKGQVRNDMGSIAGKVIGEQLKQVIESGVYIPEFYLQEKYIDPKTGQPANTSAIAARIFMAFENELMRPGSRTLMEIAQHELLPANEQTRAIRREYYQKKAAELLTGEKGLIQKEIDRIQGLVKVDAKRQEERLKERNKAASPEPATAGSQLPSTQNEQQLLAQAEEEAKKQPIFASASPGDKQAMILTAYHRIKRK